MGRTAYVDFGVVYPPGMVLFGKLLGTSDVGTIRAWVWGCGLALVLATSAVGYRIGHGVKAALGIGVSLSLGALGALHFGPTGAPFIITLTFLILLLTLHLLRSGISYTGMTAIALAASGAGLLRWDFPLALVVTQLTAACALAAAGPICGIENARCQAVKIACAALAALPA